jgi:hypothetical protein
MRKRGRTSAADLAVVVTHPAQRRLQPPHDLTKTEAALFRELVASCSPQHFVASDRPLLIAYVQCVLASRHWAKASRRDPHKIVVWERTIRMLATLATRLRLAPQARTRPETIARQANQRLSAYDQLREWERGGL